MSPSLASLCAGFLVLAVFFSILERFWPALPGQRWWKRRIRTDLLYWLFTPLVTGSAAKLVTIVAVVITAVLLGAPLGQGRFQPWLEARRTWFGSQPQALQALLALLLADLVSYWSHRLFHAGRLWRFHAIHHAAEQVDWLSSVRVHPVNEVLMRVLHTVPLFIVGFRPEILAGAIPFFTFYAIFLHANLPWSFGPLRYVIATPAFHRWHHTSQDEGMNKNFAGLFPLFDLLFGTFYLPVGRGAERFGVAGEQIPEGFWAQLIYPFRARRGSVPQVWNGRPSGAMTSGRAPDERAGS